MNNGQESQWGCLFFFRPSIWCINPIPSTISYLSILLYLLTLHRFIIILASLNHMHHTQFPHCLRFHSSRHMPKKFKPHIIVKSRQRMIVFIIVFLFSYWYWIKAMQIDLKIYKLRSKCYTACQCNRRNVDKLVFIYIIYCSLARFFFFAFFTVY